MTCGHAGIRSHQQPWHHEPHIFVVVTNSKSRSESCQRTDVAALKLLRRQRLAVVLSKFSPQNALYVIKPYFAFMRDSIHVVDGVDVTKNEGCAVSSKPMR